MDHVFNWPIKKDLPGTQKIQLPRIVVTPPAPNITMSVFKRKKRPRKINHPVAAPSKLVLDPSFWSPQPETTQSRKQRVLFTCRNFQCAEQFSSVRQRKMHEGHCFKLDEVFIQFFYSLMLQQ